MRYGYFNEFGTLTTREFDTPPSNLGNPWKEVEDVVSTQLVPTQEYHHVVAIPFDNGDTIGFKYEERFDKHSVQQEIDALKTELSDGDYKVIKCYEASLTGSELPYDMTTLSNERQSIRNKINRLEDLLNNA